MKKLLSLILAALCLLSAIPAALAADTTYELPELNMTIDAPEGWYVSTRDIKENDPNLELLGMDRKGLANYYKEKGIYLNMISPDPDAMISVFMEDCSDAPGYADSNNVPDEVLLQSASKMQGEGTLSDYSVYMHKQTKFTVLNTNNSIQYVTLINGQSICVMMISFNGEISDSLKQTLKSAVDSITFTKVSSKPASEAGKYELSDLNMTIDAPEGWYAFTQDVEKDDPNLKVLGIDGEELAGQLKESNAYLDMIRTDPYAQIFVYLIDSESSRNIYDFNLFSDEDLKTQIEAAKPEDLAYGEGFIYKHKQAKFYVYDFTIKLDNGETAYGTEYETVINGQRISIEMMYKNKGESKSLKKTLKNTVDSITFTKVTSKPVSPAETYELPKLNMTIDSVEGWLVFTQDIDENDPDLKLFGADGKALEAYYKENGIYLDMIRKDPDARITMEMTESDVGEDFNNMDDEDLLPVAFEKVKQTDRQADFSDCSVYMHKQAKFAVCDFTEIWDSGTVYGREYYTVINGQAISIVMVSPEGEISGAFAQTLKDTVDSITFTKVPAKPVPIAPDAATYELPKLNMTVHSPDGWFVFTQDVDENDPNLKYFGVDGNELADQFIENGIYINMKSPDPYAEIVVMMKDYGDTRDIYDEFNNMDDKEIRILASVEVNQIWELEAYSDWSIYTHKQTKFAMCDFTRISDGKKIYERIYFTVINGQAICIMMISPEVEISGSYTQTLKDTVDSITFTKVPPEPVDDLIIPCASLAGAVVGAIIGTIIIKIRKRKDVPPAVMDSSMFSRL